MKAGVLMVVAVVMLTGFTFQDKKRVVFFGDSITEAGVKPGGYISVLGDLLKQKGMDNRFELMGAGIGGNKRRYIPEMIGAYMLFLYFIATAVMLVLFLIGMNKKLKST